MEQEAAHLSSQVQKGGFWGSSPADEDSYFAAHSVRGTRSFFTSPISDPIFDPAGNGLNLFTRSWQPLYSDSQPRGVICMVHGYGNDISWTFQSTAIFLASNGFACFAIDLPSHGRSAGNPRAYLPDLSIVTQHCVAFFRSVFESHEQLRGLSTFLYGESMGGAICLLIHLNYSIDFAGAVLIAPMCRISDRIRPPWPVPNILMLVAKVLPTLAIVPTADLVDKSVRVEAKRIIAANNPLRYSGKPRLGTVVELLRATDELAAKLKDVRISFLVIHGSEDVVTDSDVSRALYEAAASEDKTIKIYEGMMHSLLFGETEENIARVRTDILEWLNARCRSSSSSSSDTKEQEREIHNET